MIRLLVMLMLFVSCSVESNLTDGELSQEQGHSFVSDIQGSYINVYSDLFIIDDVGGDFSINEEQYTFHTNITQQEAVYIMGGRYYNIKIGSDILYRTDPYYIELNSPDYKIFAVKRESINNPSPFIKNIEGVQSLYGDNVSVNGYGNFETYKYIKSIGSSQAIYTVNNDIGKFLGVELVNGLIYVYYKNKVALWDSMDEVEFSSSHKVVTFNPFVLDATGDREFYHKNVYVDYIGNILENGTTLYTFVESVNNYQAIYSTNGQYVGISLVNGVLYLYRQDKTTPWSNKTDVNFSTQNEAWVLDEFIANAYGNRGFYHTSVFVEQNGTITVSDMLSYTFVCSRSTTQAIYKNGYDYIGVELSGNSLYVYQNNWYAVSQVQFYSGYKVEILDDFIRNAHGNKTFYDLTLSVDSSLGHIYEESSLKYSFVYSLSSTQAIYKCSYGFVGIEYTGGKLYLYQQNKSTPWSSAVSVDFSSTHKVPTLDVFILNNLGSQILYIKTVTIVDNGDIYDGSKLSYVHVSTKNSTQAIYSKNGKYVGISRENNKLYLYQQDKINPWESADSVMFSSEHKADFIDTFVDVAVGERTLYSKTVEVRDSGDIYESYVKLYTYIGSKTTTQAIFLDSNGNYVGIELYNGQLRLYYEDWSSANEVEFSSEYLYRAWSYLGASGFSDGEVWDTQIEYYNGTPYVAYVSKIGGVSKATVKKFNGTAWVLVGAEGFTESIWTYGNANTGTINDNYSSISFHITDNGTMYLSYIYYYANTYYYRIYTYTNNKWTQLTSRSSNSYYDFYLFQLNSYNNVLHTSLDDYMYKYQNGGWTRLFSTSIGMSAYAFTMYGDLYFSRFYNSNSTSSYLNKYNGSTTTTVDTLSYIKYGTQALTNTSMAGYGQKLYIMGASGTSLRVYVYDATTSETTIMLSTTVSTAYKKIVVDKMTGIPYRAYRNTSNGKIYVHKWNESKWAFETLGDTAYITPSWGMWTDIYVHNGQIYLVFKDGARESKISVMTYYDE